MSNPKLRPEVKEELLRRWDVDLLWGQCAMKTDYQSELPPCYCVGGMLTQMHIEHKPGIPMRWWQSLTRMETHYIIAGRDELTYDSIAPETEEWAFGQGIGNYFEEVVIAKNDHPDTTSEGMKAWVERNL